VNDLDRLKKEYQDRERRLENSDLYSLSNPAYRFMKSQLRQGMLELLQRHGRPLEHSRVLEVGCGNGNILMDLGQLGANQKNLFGADLIFTRLQQAQADHSLLSLACADGQRLPYADRTFDMVAQFTVFSSVLDDAIRRNMALEMQRVLGSDGVILWYDFWWNPMNRQTRGIGRSEIRRLFPGCSIDFQRITLAPPLARRLSLFSSRFMLFLEKLRVFNTHYLAAIRPKMESSL
jgi:ubiquinone/menaquinone biosynthesis C-methylase UbiE